MVVGVLFICWCSVGVLLVFCWCSVGVVVVAVVVVVAAAAVVIVVGVPLDVKPLGGVTVMGGWWMK